MTSQTEIKGRMSAKAQRKIGRATMQNVKPRAYRATRARTNTNVVHAARRVLAQRTRGGKQEYLVDWYPTWQPKHHVPKGKMLHEWEDNIEKGHTFTMNKNIVVYKCSNPTEDDSPHQTRLMFETVLIALQKWLNRPKNRMSAELFKPRDWAFSSNEDSQLAERQAALRGQNPPSAARVMRDTYIAMRDSKCEGINDKSLIYSNVSVRFLGQVDEDIPGEDPAKRGSGPTVAFLQHMFEPMLYEMAPGTWKGNHQVHTQLSQLCEIAKRFVNKSTFLLKHVWPLFFVRLFCTSDELIASFNNEDKPLWTFPISDGWENRTRDYFLQTYIATNNWEQRAVDCVERTYLELRDRVKWHVMFRDVEDEGLGQNEEPTRLSDWRNEDTDEESDSSTSSDEDEESDSSTSSDEDTESDSSSSSDDDTDSSTDSDEDMDEEMTDAAMTG